MTKTAKKQCLNESGIYPSGNRVLVLPDPLDEMVGDESKIFIPETVRERHALAQTAGTLIESGPDAWCHMTTHVSRLIDGAFKTVERHDAGYSEPFAKPGDRVAFARYGGLQVTGVDGQTYRILNDEDITARVSPDVEFTDFESRDPLGKPKQ